MSREKCEVHCASFFYNPPAFAGAVWFASTVILLIPTAVILSPLGKNQRNGKGDLDAAQAKADSAATVARDANAKVNMAKQTLLDITCAEGGYENFNMALNAFVQRLNNATGSPLDKLSNLYALNFISDISTTDTRTESYTYPKTYQIYDYHCLSYCYSRYEEQVWGFGYRYVTQQEKYNIRTTTITIAHNLLAGPGLSFPALDCGTLSRNVRVNGPQQYQLSYSNVQSGSRESGTIFRDIRIENGCRITGSYTLNGNTISLNANVPNTASQLSAAEQTTNSIYQFLVTAVAAFSAVGSNFYTNSKNNVMASLPSAEQAASTANDQLVLANQFLENEKEKYSGVDGNYTESLSIWLSVFFVVPVVLATIAFIISCQCNQRNNDSEEYGTEMTI